MSPELILIQLYRIGDSRFPGFYTWFRGRRGIIPPVDITSITDLH